MSLIIQNVKGTWVYTRRLKYRGADQDDYFIEITGLGNSPAAAADDYVADLTRINTLLTDHLAGLRQEILSSHLASEN